MRRPERLLRNAVGHSLLPSLLLLLGLLTACEDSSDILRSRLCDPEIQSAAAAESQSPPLSTDGGRLVLNGRFLWQYFSADAANPTPLPGEPTVTPALEPYVTFDLAARVGGQEATILRAFERTVYPTLRYTDLDGTEKTSDCSTCTACTSANLYGCGNCDAACAGCEQVVELSIGALPSSSGQAAGGSLQVEVVLFSSLGQTPALAVELPLACQDGADNDGDGLGDSLDPECLSTGWSEWSP